MPKNTATEAAATEIIDPAAAPETYQDPQPSRDEAAATVASASGPVMIRLLVDHESTDRTKIPAGSLVKTAPEIAAGLVAGGIADSDPAAVSYAVESGADTHEI